MARSRIAATGTLVVATIAVTGLAVRAGLWTWPRGGVASAAGPSAVAVDRAHAVTVVGEGDVPVAPTSAGVVVGVAVRRPTAQAAFDRAGAEMAAVTSALKQQGVAAADIQTSALQVSAETTNGSVADYLVGSSVNVTIRRVESAQAVVKAATQAAGNDAQVEGISFSNAPDADAIEAARHAAMDAAHNQAEHWATLSGHHLGEVISVSEGGDSQHPCTGCGGAAPGPGTAGVPISPGVGHVTEVVTVVYALTD
jgi:uncharacterized protein YggE